MASNPDELARDINRVSAWLALDDFEGDGPGTEVLRDLSAIALLGNQVIATLTAACTLTQRSPRALLVLSGGAGHSTSLLYENLRNSTYGDLVRRGLVRETMGEAEMYAVVARNAFAIPDSRILVENRSTNSGENARYSLQMLRAVQRQGPVLILQDPTMQRRSVLTWVREAEMAGVDARALSHAAFVPRVEAYPVGLRLVDEHAQGTWTFERFIALAIGEIKRLNDDENGYGPKGRNYLPHVEIPPAVLESYFRVAASRLAQQAIR